MSHTVSGILNQGAREFAYNSQNGGGVGFNVNFGVKCQDKDRNDIYTNYQATFFVDNSKQSMLNFYREALQAGALVVVSAEKIRIDVFAGEKGQRITLELLQPRLENVGQRRQPTQSGSWGQPQQPQANSGNQQRNNQNSGSANGGGQNGQGANANQRNNQNNGNNNPPVDFDDDIPF